VLDILSSFTTINSDISKERKHILSKEQTYLFVHCNCWYAMTYQMVLTAIQAGHLQHLDEFCMHSFAVVLTVQRNNTAGTFLPQYKPSCALNLWGKRVNTHGNVFMMSNSFWNTQNKSRSCASPATVKYSLHGRNQTCNINYLTKQ
jgi:hypothetical protein